MRWDGERESSNVDDARGSGGGGFGLPIGGRGIGIGTVAVALVAGWVFGINPLAILGLMGGGGSPTAQTAPRTHPPPANDEQARFVSVVLASTEDVWTDAFRQANAQYIPPRLTLFRGTVPTACGTGQSAMGPFYCPSDQRVYIDLDFFDVLKQRLAAPGDFAQAYVVAHEVGHHVQHLTGQDRAAEAARRGGSTAEANAASVKLELQADCYAGVWGHRSQQAKQWLDPGDLEEALNAASKIGDDALQQRSRGTVVPESFTHGSSAQRVAWFKRGFTSGRVADCDTGAAGT